MLLIIWKDKEIRFSATNMNAKEPCNTWSSRIWKEAAIWLKDYFLTLMESRKVKSICKMGVKTNIIEKFSCNCWSGCNSKKNNAAFLDISKIRMHYFNHNFIIKKYGGRLNCDTLLLPDFDIFSMRFVFFLWDLCKTYLGRFTERKKPD